MSAQFQIRPSVGWKWESGTAKNKIQNIHTSIIFRITKGNEVNCRGSEDNPSLALEQTDETVTLKLESERMR